MKKFLSFLAIIVFIVLIYRSWDTNSFDLKVIRKNDSSWNTGIIKYKVEFKNDMAPPSNPLTKHFYLKYGWKRNGWFSTYSMNVKKKFVSNNDSVLYMVNFDTFRFAQKYALDQFIQTFTMDFKRIQVTKNKKQISGLKARRIRVITEEEPNLVVWVAEKIKLPNQCFPFLPDKINRLPLHLIIEKEGSKGFSMGFKAQLIMDEKPEKHYFTMRVPETHKRVEFEERSDVMEFLTSLRQ